MTDDDKRARSTNPDAQANDGSSGKKHDERLAKRTGKLKSHQSGAHGSDRRPPDATPASAGPQAASKEEPKRFDFGGLPDRDLKKNLGCG